MRNSRENLDVQLNPLNSTLPGESVREYTFITGIVPVMSRVYFYKESGGSQPDRYSKTNVETVMFFAENAMEIRVLGGHSREAVGQSAIDDLRRRLNEANSKTPAPKKS